MDNVLRSEITEAILRRAVIDAYEQDMAEIPPEEELAEMHSFSHAHDARMRALFKRDKRKELLHKVFTVTKRAAVIALILATAFFAVLMTDTRVQASVRETIISWYDRFTLFRFQNGGDVDYAAEWFPQFVPKGFEVSEITEFYIGRYIFLESPDGYYIIFQYHPAEGATAAVDNEFTAWETIRKDGIDFLVATPLPESEHHSQVIWRMNGFVFLLLSHLDAEVLLEMAVSVTSS